MLCRVKQKSEGAARLSPDAETHIANDSPTEALFQFSQDFGLGNLLEFIMQSWLEYADVKDSVAQRDRRGVCGDEFPDNFRPRITYLFRAIATLLKTARLPRSVAELTLFGLIFFDLNSEYSCHHDQ